MRETQCRKNLPGHEIREIVKKAEQLKKLGLEITWENIGDPIQKHHKLPAWIKDIISNLVKTDDVYGYCPSKGMLETREFLAKQAANTELTASM